MLFEVWFGFYFALFTALFVTLIFLGGSCAGLVTLWLLVCLFCVVLGVFFFCLLVVGFAGCWVCFYSVVMFVVPLLF